MWRPLLTIAALGISLPAAAASQAAVSQVRSLDSAWARSYATHDTALAIQLIADDAVITGGNGALKTKAQELGDIRPTAGLRMHFFRTGDVQVRCFTDSCVVTGLAEWEFTFNERVSNSRRRYTAVYVRGGPLGYQMTALHIGPAPAR
jgi:hypothetical protein